MPNAQLQQLVAKFVSDLEIVVRDTALQAVHASLTGSSPAAAAPAAAAPKKPGRKPGKKAAAPAAKAAAKAPAEKKGRRGGRRSPAEIEATAHKVLEHVRKNPGQRSEVIRAALKLDKPEWLSAVGRLVDKGQLKQKGEKRATTYTAG